MIVVISESYREACLEIRVDNRRTNLWPIKTCHQELFDGFLFRNIYAYFYLQASLLPDVAMYEEITYIGALLFKESSARISSSYCQTSKREFTTIETMEYRLHNLRE